MYLIYNYLQWIMSNAYNIDIYCTIKESAL